VRTTPDKQLASCNKLADLALEGAILLPCHDPMLSQEYDQHGERWLREVAKQSIAAARGYKAAAKRVLEGRQHE